MVYLVSLAVMVFGYLMGGINSAIIVSKLRGMDIREHGSGNAGATNALRTMGKKAGVFVLLGDILKAVIVMVAVRLIFPDNAEMWYLAGVGAVLGHNFPIYFKFKGGKGVAVSAIASLFVDWRIGLIALAVGILIILITKYVSVGSMSGAIASVLAACLLPGAPDKAWALYVILALLMIRMHMPNIERLMKGEENRIGKREG